jgi:hypothetical protein
MSSLHPLDAQQHRRSDGVLQDAGSSRKVDPHPALPHAVSEPVPVHLSEAPVAIIWDGFRQIVALWNDGGDRAARLLAAERSGGSVELIASADSGDNVLIAMLPAGCRVVHCVTVTEAGDLATIPVQLDARLTVDEADATLEGLVALQLRASPGAGSAGPTLTVERGDRDVAPPATLVGLGLNRVTHSGGESYRILAGPFLHPEDGRSTATRVTGRIGDGLHLDFAGAADGVIVAHLSAAMRQARQDLAAIDPELRMAVEAELDGLLVAPELNQTDASGLSHVAAFRRGFRLLRAGSGETRLAIPDWQEGDQVLLLAQPRRRVVWTDEGEAVAGAPIAIHAEAGRLSAVSLRESYAPSAATGLTIGGGNRGALVSRGGRPLASAPDDGALAAIRLAARLLEAAAPASQATRLGDAIAGWSQAFAAQPGSGPLAKLDASARRSPRPDCVLAGLAETAGIDASRLEELSERALAEQVAMLLWAVSAPRLAARACAARLLLPLPAESRRAELEALLAWYEDPTLPQRLGRGALALTGQDRKAARLLHEMAASVHQGWLDIGVATEAGEALEMVRGALAARPVSKLDALLADLRRDAPRQGPQAPALEALGRMRSELGEAARHAGAAEGLVEEMGRRLAELSPVEILLLHGYFAGLRQQAARSAAAIVLLDCWEAEAGCAGLAMRADRSGDALAGASRLAGMTAGLVEALRGIVTLAPALAQLDSAIDGVLGKDDGPSPQAVSLRATLAGYGRLLLLHRAMRQADAVFASVPFARAALADSADAGFGAAYRRLRAGTSETLGRYLAAAGLVSGRDHDWGATDVAVRPASSR